MSTQAVLARRTVLAAVPLAAVSAVISSQSAAAVIGSRTVRHGLNARASRPRRAGRVLWVGAARPLNARVADEWIPR